MHDWPHPRFLFFYVYDFLGAKGLKCFLDDYFIIDGYLCINQFSQRVHLIVLFFKYPLEVIVEAFQQPLSHLNVLYQQWLLDFILPFHLCNDKL